MRCVCKLSIGFGLCVVILLAAAADRVSGGVAYSPGRDDAGIAATVDLMMLAASTREDGGHHVLLKSMRRMKDPAFVPFFEKLASRKRSDTRVHGVLGLAELRSPKRLSYADVVAVDDVQLQTELISVAIGEALMSDSVMLELAKNELRGEGPRLLVVIAITANRKTAEGYEVFLKEQAASENVLRRGLAGMVLNEIGDPSGEAGLRALASGDEAYSDEMIGVLMGEAMRHGYVGMGRWGLTFAKTGDLGPDSRGLAIQAAVGLGAMGGGQFWSMMFAGTNDLAGRLRLSLVAVRAGGVAMRHGIDTSGLIKIYDTMIGTGDGLIAALGRMGKAVVVGDEAERVAAFGGVVESGYGPGIAWLISWLDRNGSPDTIAAVVPLLWRGVDFENGKNAGRATDVGEAIRLLAEKTPGVLPEFAGFFADDSASDKLKRLVALGLLTAYEDETVNALPADLSPSAVGGVDVARLLLILNAQDASRVTSEDLESLWLIARGAGGLPIRLRLRAGWLAAAALDRDSEVIGKALKRMR